jgi:thiamine biosynthesis lipoprotein
MTDGAFDIRIAPLTDLWGFRTDNPHIPDIAAISKALPLTRSDFILKEDSCELKTAGSGLDVGGIAKGFAIDLAVEKLQSLGIKSGIVSAGGDVKVFGSLEKNKKWRIGIRHPRKADDFYTIIEIEKGAVSTSGDYQQYFEVDGIRYHHIIDPETGYPPHHCVSATVIAETGATADALATALFVMGPEKGTEWLKSHPQYQGMIIYFNEKGELTDYRTAGIE